MPARLASPLEPAPAAFADEDRGATGCDAWSSEKPRVLCKVAGGPGIGMGHVLRTLELADALEEAGLHAVGFICNDDPRSREAIGGANRRLWRDTDDVIQLIDTERVDLLLMDHPGVAGEFCDGLRRTRPALRILALDCFDMTTERVDAIVNLINHHPTLPKPQSSKVRYYEGAGYAIVRREFMGARGSDRQTPEAAGELLITFGGADPQGHTLRVLEVLSDAMPSRVRVRVVVGPNFSRQAEITAAARALGAEVHEHLRQVASLFRGADLAISGGGTTMLELACVGTPTIVIPQTVAEARFAASFSSRGAVRVCAVEAGPLELRRVIADLIRDRAARERMTTVGRTLVDGRGKHRIAELARSLCPFPNRR